jgi:hypothetical protein
MIIILYGYSENKQLTLRNLDHLIMNFICYCQAEPKTFPQVILYACKQHHYLFVAEYCMLA